MTEIFKKRLVKFYFYAVLSIGCASVSFVFPGWVSILEAQNYYVYIPCLESKGNYYKTTLTEYTPSDSEKKEERFSNLQGIYFWEMADWAKTEKTTPCGKWDEDDTLNFSYPGLGVFEFYRDMGSDDFFGFYWKQSITPLTPANLQATAGDGQATISWDAAMAADSYVVSYKTSSSSWMDAGESKDTSKTITGLTNGVVYSFSVQAKNSAGTGSSAEVSVMPKSK